MEGSLRLAVSHYQTLCEKYGHKTPLKHVETPFIDDASHDPEQDEDEPQGVLATPAASVLMKVMYAARLARFDLLSYRFLGVQTH